VSSLWDTRADRVHVAGFSFGVAGVLFAGIAIGAPDERFVLPEPVWVLGLALFVYTVGLTSGRGLVAALRARGLAANALVFVAIGVSAVLGPSFATGWARNYLVLQGFYGSDGTRTRDLRRDRPAF
jgi:uncharacterized transporter YbjL